MSDEPQQQRITLDAGSREVQKIVVVATLMVAVAAFAAGVPALVWAGQAAGLGAFSYLVPIVVDAGLTSTGLAAAVRHAQRRSARLESALMLGLTVISSIVQITHSLTTAPGGYVAATVVAALPMALLISTHSALRAVVDEPVKRAVRRVAQPSRQPSTSATSTTVQPATQPRKPRSKPAGEPAAPVTHTVADAVTEVHAGRMSIRAAATAAGVSRYAISQAI